MPQTREIVIPHPGEVTDYISYVDVPDLAVKAVTPVLLPRASQIDTWTRTIAGKLLQQWRLTGNVSVYPRGVVVDTISQAYHNMSQERAEGITGSLIEAGLVREEDQWLIPMTPLLRCATPEDVTPGTAWWCYTKTYYDVNILLSK